MSTSVARRGRHGHYLPGQSANPGGRPASLAHVRELLRPHAERYVAELVELLGHADPAVRLAAIREFGDRYLGKPVAQIEQDIKHTDVGALIRDMYLTAVQVKPAEPEPIDVTPAEPAPTAPASPPGGSQW